MAAPRSLPPPTHDSWGYQRPAEFDVTPPPSPVTVTIETGPDAILVLPGYGAG